MVTSLIMFAMFRRPRSIKWYVHFLFFFGHLNSSILKCSCVWCWMSLVGLSISIFANRQSFIEIANLRTSSSHRKGRRRLRTLDSPRSSSPRDPWFEVWSARSIGKPQNCGMRTRSITTKSMSFRVRWYTGRCCNGICRIRNSPGRYAYLSTRCCRSSSLTVTYREWTNTQFMRSSVQNAKGMSYMQFHIVDPSLISPSTDHLYLAYENNGAPRLSTSWNVCGPMNIKIDLLCPRSYKNSKRWSTDKDLLNFTKQHWDYPLLIFSYHVLFSASIILTTLNLYLFI